MLENKIPKRSRWRKNGSGGLQSRASPERSTISGSYFYARDDIKGAFAYFQEAAKRAYLPAMFAAAGILEEAGHLDRARIIFEMAARRGHAESQDALCRIHIDAGTDADYEQAIYWGKLAAEQGLASAQARLGTIFRNRSVA